MGNMQSEIHRVRIPLTNASVYIGPGRGGNGRDYSLGLKSDNLGEIPVHIYHNPKTKGRRFDDEQKDEAFERLIYLFGHIGGQLTYDIDISVDPPKKQTMFFSKQAGIQLLKTWDFSFIRTDFNDYGYGSMKFSGHSYEDPTNSTIVTISLKPPVDTSKPVLQDFGRKR